MIKEAKFNSKSILDIQFEKDVKGYNPLQVDQTLDLIIEDYVMYENFVNNVNDKIAKLEKDIANLNSKLRTSELELEKAKSELKALPNKINSTQDNLALLKRVDTLERALYKKGVDPKKI